MFRPPLPQQAAQIRHFFADQGYTEEQLRNKLGLSELPCRRLRNQARLLDATRESNCLNALLRWFWIGVPCAAADVRDSVPQWFLELAMGCGLLVEAGGQLVPELMLVPTDGLLIGSDPVSRMEAGDPQFVLWPNPTSRLLTRLMVRQPSSATLDLGTGNGVLALVASAHSKAVVATDLNPRAVAYAEFNMQLNDAENVSVLVGDGLEPVQGAKFDLIIANPPFFVTPASRFLFCDNTLNLDQMCRKWARDAAAHLHDGGYFQMLCEWAQVSGQPWEERVSQWFDDIGCDVWIMKGCTQDPADYAQERIRETNPSLERDATLYDSYMNYYRTNNVEAIHDGIIVIRRRSGKNWLLMEDVPQTPTEPFGDAIQRRFEARDFLQAHADDEQLLQIKPRLSPISRLEEAFQPVNGKWQLSSASLRLSKGLPCKSAVQPLVAEFLSACSGSRTLAEIIGEFATQADVPSEKVTNECILMVRMLIDRGFVTA